MSDALKTPIAQPDSSPRVRVRHRVEPLSVAPFDAQTKHPQAVAPLEGGGDRSVYEVGYARPPKDKQFKKGVSGNKNGRPKGSRNASTIANDLLNRKATVTIDGKRMKVTTLEVAMLQQVKKMIEKSDLKALQFLTTLAGTAHQGPGIAGPLSAEVMPPDAIDLSILAYHRREQMMAKGIPEEVVDQLLEELGFGQSRERDAA